MRDDAPVSFEELFALIKAAETREGKWQGQWYMTYCPLHKGGKEKVPDLGLSRAGVLRCFVGCEFKDVMKALRERAGVHGDAPKGVTRQESQRSASQGHSRGTPSMVYQYRDHAGKVIAEKARFNIAGAAGEKPKKSFAWRVHGEHEWNGIADIDRSTLSWYGVEALLPAQYDQWVYVVEGEECQRVCQEKGLLALTWGGGAGQQPTVEALELLRDRPVALWPDNDGAGRQYMAILRARLRGVAKETRLVNVDVPEKGDAVDWFTGGGSVEAVEGEGVGELVTECLGADHFVVLVPSEFGTVTYEFDEVHTGNRGEVNCELSVRVGHDVPYAQRINLLSASARAALQRELTNQFGKEVCEGGWTKMCSVAWARVLDAYHQADRTVPLTFRGQMPARRYTIEELVPEGQVSMLYAPPASTKSFLSVALALSVVVGNDFCGLTTIQQPVIYCDWECGEEDTSFRLTRLLLGLGLDPEILPGLPLHYWRGGGVPLADQADSIRRFAEREGCGMVIVDSIGYAAGGDLFDPAAAMRFFGALDRIRLTTLCVGQVPAADKEKLYGNQFWEYGPHGRIWLLKRQSEEESDDVDVALECKKTSNGRWPGKLSFHVHFDGDTGPVRLWRQDYGSVAAFVEDADMGERIWRLLERGALKEHEITAALGVDGDAVHAALRKGDGTRFVKVAAKDGVYRWGRLTRG